MMKNWHSNGLKLLNEELMLLLFKSAYNYYRYIQFLFASKSDSIGVIYIYIIIYLSIKSD